MIAEVWLGARDFSRMLLGRWQTPDRCLRDARSVVENAAWYSEQVVGGWLRPLEQLVARLRDVEALESIGFLLDCSRQGIQVDEVDEEHPLMAEQNCRAATLGRLVCALLFREVSSSLWFGGAPGCFAGLADPGHRDRIMVRLQRIHYLLTKRVPEWKGSFWKHMIQRSVLNDVYVQKVPIVYSGGGWVGVGVGVNVSF